MSDFKPVDEETQPSISLRRKLSGEGDKPILIPLNANAVGNRCNTNSVSTIEDVQRNNSAVFKDPNGNHPNPEEHGATSMKKRSKRPIAKPSAAILLAKQNALGKKRSSQTDIQIMMTDHLQPARDSKDNVRKPTGVVYDLKMLQHYCLWDSKYPENPDRLSSVIYRCEQLGLLARAKHVEPRLATKDEILSVHSTDHIENLKRICETQEATLEELERHSSHYDAIYFHPSTYGLSLLAAGSTIDLVNAVLDGQIQNGMAIIRPPGHHAMKSEYCGYCYFNNVAIAAKRALEMGKASRILIVDFDVHHGQATQQMFYDDPRVLYFSTHRFEHGTFWPNLEESNFQYIGSSDGVGFNCNVPLNKIGMGNSDFLSIWHQLLLPMAYQFNPDLIIVSAGYDAALGCLEGEMEVTPQCYPHLVSPLMGLANGKVAVILEGGYCLKSLAEGAALTLKTLLGDACPKIDATKCPTNEAVESVLDATYMLRSKWSMLIGQTHVDEGEETMAQTQKQLHIPRAKYLWTEPKPEVYDTRNCYPEQSSNVQKLLDERISQLILTTDLQQPSHRVAIVYDDLMLKHRNSAEPGHPERPERISNIFACHGDFGLLERCHRLQPREATEDELLLIHTEEHVRKMKGTQKMTARDLYKFKENFNSIYFNNHSYKCALVAAGSILQVVDAVVDGSCRSGVAVVRPPGHHAEIDEPCGFCLFNNVALAAKYAQANHQLNKILILDWDVHHGNGIQHIFEDDPRVLYISIHRYDHGGFFPCSSDADYNVVGVGAGAGFNVNIPWNRKGMGDTEYLAAFLNVVMPIAYEYNPELVFVSAGFDAAKGDPLGGCKVTPEGYAHMTHMLSSLANGRVVVALEGGYNLTAIAYSMTLCTKALLGDPIPPLQLKEEVDRVAIESIHDVLQTQAEYWSVLKPFRKCFPFSTELIPVGSYSKVGITSLESSLERLNIKTKSPVGIGGQRSVIMDHENNEIPVGDATAGASSNSSTIQTLELMGATAGAVGGSQTESLTDVISKMQEVVSDKDGQMPGVIVQPSDKCPHFDQIGAVPDDGINVDALCVDCNNKGENWICLTCYKVYCSRYVKGHMVEHGTESGHKIAMSFADLSVWCYACDDYIDHPTCRPPKSAAHLSKFGNALPS
ncbi:unnamed protein product [Orchesella dallaii]|uniref:UBP-type domain-containing protein n=1 Tax=Orchesella dallaii TaxID=48710 RepID=A0ABP1QSW3_9HEXA